MPLQKRIAAIGLTKQASKGAGASTPATLSLGLRSGAVLDDGTTQQADAMTFTSRIGSDDIRTAVNPAVAFQTRAYPRSLGALLFGALGGNVDSGAGPYTHTITPAADVPYWTVFSQLDTEYHKLVDCKIDSLTIGWTERGAIDVDVTFMGITYTGYTAAWTATNVDSAVPFFVAPGGTFQMESLTTTPVNFAITGGSLKISNNLVPVPLSKAIIPDDLVPGEQVVEFTLNAMPADTTEWRKITTGSAGGTTFTVPVPYGSYNIVFTIDASNSVTLTALRVAFEATYPPADPAGGPAELVFTSRTKKPAGAALTAVVVNALATY